MVLAGSSAFAAIDSVKYPGTPDENYEFKSLDSNTSEKEQYLSLYKDGTVRLLQTLVFTVLLLTMKRIRKSTSLLRMSTEMKDFTSLQLTVSHLANQLNL